MSGLPSMFGLPENSSTKNYILNCHRSYVINKYSYNKCNKKKNALFRCEQIGKI